MAPRGKPQFAGRYGEFSRMPLRCAVWAQSVQLCLTPCDAKDCTRQSPLSIRFPRQEYWSGLPFPSPWDLSDPGIKPKSPTLPGGFFTTEPPGKPDIHI